MARVRGGDRIASKLHDIARKLGEGGELTAKIGFFIGDTYPDGQPLPLVAAVNEFGAPSRGIPPRPFMRMTIAKHQAEWPGLAAAQLKDHGFDARVALSRLGETVQGQLQDTIRSNVPPPNAPATVERKGFDRTLIDTGFMLQHVKWTVEEA